VRHGDSTDNLKSLWAGWKDAPLSNHGMNQAKALGSSFSSLTIKALYSSPLKRAHATAMQIFEHQDPRPVFEESPLLREQYWGFAEGRPWSAPKPTSVAMKDYFPLPAGRSARFPEGESREDVAARASEAIDLFIVPHIFAAQGLPEDETNIVIVAHGIFVAEMTGELLRRRSGGASEAHRFSGLVNTGWTRLVLGFEGENPGANSQTSTTTESQAQEDCTEKVNVLAESAAPPPTKPTMERSLTPDLFVKMLAVNQAPHLDGLKRQGGGIGSSPYDEKQRSLHDFLGGKAQM